MKNRDRDIFLRAMVAKQRILHGYNMGQIAEIIGISKSAFYDKMKSPGKFRLVELRELCRILKFSVEEKASIL